MKRLLLYNAIVLAVFCGVWIWGYYMSAYWMRIIDLGLPWSWLVALFSLSYFATLLPLRKSSWGALKSLLPAAIITSTFYLFVQFCDVAYDPFY